MGVKSEKMLFDTFELCDFTEITRVQKKWRPSVFVPNETETHKTTWRVKLTPQPYLFDKKTHSEEASLTFILQYLGKSSNHTFWSLFPRFWAGVYFFFVLFHVFAAKFKFLSVFFSKKVLVRLPQDFCLNLKRKTHYR